ncbi:MAG TPA: hypothetical protein VG498_10960 [Terriglobales bacterium]|nr:hypothetical protein [Terriglobales bacterium]
MIASGTPITWPSTECPREWYRRGIRHLRRTIVEGTRDVLANRIGRDVASVAGRIRPANRITVIDPFAGSCNTLFWILRHLPDAEGIAFESDALVFELTHRNFAALSQSVEVVQGNYAKLLDEVHLPLNRNIVAFVAQPWTKYGAWTCATQRLPFPR